MDEIAFRRIMWDQQLRAQEFGVPLPRFTIWDPAVPDARVQDPKKRGQFSHREWGPMSRLYCVSCGQPSPFASPDTMAKVFYKCLRCVHRSGEPEHAIRVPGTEGV